MARRPARLREIGFAACRPYRQGRLAPLRCRRHLSPQLHGDAGFGPIPNPPLNPLFANSWPRGSWPPAAAAPQQEEDAEHDQEDGPEHVASEPSEQSQVVEEVVRADDNQRDSPKPSPPAEPRPRPAAVPTRSLPLRSDVVALSIAPGAPFVA